MPRQENNINGKSGDFVRTVTMLTIVPSKYAKDFKEKGRIGNFSTLPQIHPAALDVIRNFVSENIGYDDLPLASLKCAVTGSLAGVDFNEYLSVNSRDSVLFQLEIPEDMIVSVNYDALLKYSGNMKHATDEFQMAMERDMLESELFVGIADDSEGIISFIPFLDYNRCKFFARLDTNFKVERNTDVGRSTGIRLKELTSFE